MWSRMRMSGFSLLLHPSSTSVVTTTVDTVLRRVTCRQGAHVYDVCDKPGQNAETTYNPPQTVAAEAAQELSWIYMHLCNNPGLQWQALKLGSTGVVLPGAA
jgi:hypothetical protein